jgi:hypothetical protein
VLIGNNAFIFGLTENSEDPFISLADPAEIVKELKDASKGATVQPISASIRVLSNVLVVCHVPDQQVFTVSAPDGRVHAVRLFPNQTCTCPASTTCCHVLAVKRSIGLECAERKVVNLTQLRRNSR